MDYKGEGIDVPSGLNGETLRAKWPTKLSQVGRFILFFTSGPPKWKLEVVVDDWEGTRDTDLQAMIVKAKGHDARTVVWYCDEYVMPGSSRIKLGRMVPDPVWLEYRREIRRRLGYDDG